MGKWSRKLAALTVSASLVGTSFIPTYASAKTIGTDFSNKIGSDFIQKETEKLQKKLKETPPAYSKDTLIVKYNNKLSGEVHKKAGTTVVKEISSLNYAVVKLKSGSSLDKALKVYQTNNQVISVGQSTNFVQLASNDPKTGSQYHLPLLQIEKAQKLAGKNSVKVAVIDTGIYSKHPELEGKLLPSYNVLEPMNQGFADSHGTHVAGIIAAKKDNGIGGYGVNPNVKILPIDVFNRDGLTTDFTVAEAIMYAADHGAKVVNMSLGSVMPSPVVEDAVKYALSKKVTLVAASGNDSLGQLNYPAAIEGVIGVGSSNDKNELSTYSNYGSAQDLVAPGEEVYAPIYEYERKTSFRKMSGTSMASPVVAGVASLLLSKYPSLTPEQVEYILKHTAKDLGSKGYDTKYGYGLVNPVAALSYDIKKIPKSVLNPKTEQDILAVAQNVQFTDGKAVKEGNITKPNEIHWVKVDVKKGEYVQTVLEGSKQYDYQYKMNLYSPSENHSYDVNQLKEGKKEGKLLKIPADGILTIGIKDSNGNYDDSGKNLSHYKLSIHKLDQLVDDGNSLENVTKVEALPFNTESHPLTFTGENGDEDYFRVKVEEPSVLRISATGVPGVDSTINVYPAEMFFPPTQEGQPSPEVNVKAPTPEPMFSANNAGLSDGETLTFEAMPQMEYIVSVTNKVNPYEMWYWDPTRVSNLLAEESAVPYNVSIESRTITGDEDGLPNMGTSPEEKLKEGQLTSLSYSEEKIEQRSEAAAETDPILDEMDEEQRYIRSIIEQSRPYNVGETGNGFLQNIGDEDWFNFTAPKSGIYEWSLGNANELPMLEVYEIKEYKDEKGKVFTYLNQVAYNFEFGWWEDILKPKFFAGLTQGKQYLVRVSPSRGKIALNDYSFTAKYAYAYPQDKYEDNNDFEQAKTLPSSPVTANLAIPYDQDIFYFKPKNNDLMAVTMEQQKLSKTDAAKYPKELQQKMYGYAVIVEDSNANKKLDEIEFGNEKLIYRGFEYGRSVGSFQAKKGKGYFIIATGFTATSIPISVNPYKLSVQSAPKSDEDAKNVVKNNKPSKPLSLKKVNSKLMQATGYFNPGVPYGDSDWYSLKVDKTKKVKITLSAKSEIDGEISIYQNGKLIKHVDYYAEGDSEVASITLKKGTYHIKVKDINGNASASPYTLKVE